MSRLLAVTARELRERWLLFPASLLFGLNPLVLPAFGVDRRVMPFVGLVTALGLGAAAAVLSGSTMLARDAANGRLGFLFSRPVSWPTIWGGKWLASLVLVASSGGLAAIPFMVAYPSESHGGSWLRTLAAEPGWALAFGALLLGVAIANFCATAYRSRSPWLVLDMVLVGAALWFTGQHVAPLWRYGVVGKDGRSLALAIVPLAVGLFAGSAAQVAVGRTDIRRAHCAMSVVFWAVVGTTLALAAGYWTWVRSAGPADVDVYALTRDPGGRFVFVDGSGSRGGWYPYRRFVDTASGRWLAAPEPDPQDPLPGFGALFSADGRYGVLTASDERGTALVRLDLGTNPPRSIRIGLESSPPPGWTTSFALSPSAASVFVAHESGASIFSLPSGRRVATTTIAPGWRPAATRFLGEGAARTWLVPSSQPGIASPRAEMSVVDLAVDGRTQTSAFAVASAFDLPFRSWRAVLPDAEGRRIVTHDAGVHLRDGATGALLATLAAPDGGAEALFLSDGRIVVGESRRGDANHVLPGAMLRVFDRDGAPLAEIALDLRPPGLGVGPEVAPGRILVSSFRAPYLAEDTLVVDVAEGRVVDRLKGLRPVRGVPFGPAATAAESGFGSVQFFRDAAGRVVRIDLAGGSRAIVAGPGAPAGERLNLD
jgi:hypothetical protein